MLLNFLKRKILVEFVDSSTNKGFAYTNMPVAQLPQTFDRPTIMHIGDDDWNVVSATPKDISEIKKTKKLRLVLKKVISVDPKEILFTLPTICEELPGLINADDKTPDISILEDDWRQVEFISNSQENKQCIIREIESINKIYQSAKAGDEIRGFKNVHARSELKTPLCNTSLTLDNVLSSFQMCSSHSLGFYGGQSSIVANGFVLEFSEYFLYGLTDSENAIVSLALKQKSGQIVSDKMAGQLKSFCDEFELLLLDWVNMRYLLD